LRKLFIKSFQILRTKNIHKADIVNQMIIYDKILIRSLQSLHP